eukprot:jgi/Chlat1/411/Chrsp10S01511
MGQVDGGATVDTSNNGFWACLDGHNESSNDNDHGGVKRKPRVCMMALGNRQNIIDIGHELKPEIEKYMDVVLEDYNCTDCLHGIAAELDIVIVLGGDGSVLKAAQQMGKRQVPVVGINCGHLGFLPSVPRDQVLQVLPEIARGRCKVVEHLMLECCVLRGGEGEGEREVVGHRIGLNEVTVRGEPILVKTLQAFVISPLGPHTLTIRPIVESADRVFEMRPKVMEGSEVAIIVDGRHLCNLQPGDVVRVCRSESTFKLIEVADGVPTYYRTLTEKLGWSGRMSGKRYDECGRDTREYGE